MQQHSSWECLGARLKGGTRRWNGCRKDRSRDAREIESRLRASQSADSALLCRPSAIGSACALIDGSPVEALAVSGRCCGILSARTACSPPPSGPRSAASRRNPNSLPSSRDASARRGSSLPLPSTGGSQARTARTRHPRTHPPRRLASHPAIHIRSTQTLFHQVPTVPSVRRKRSKRWLKETGRREPRVLSVRYMMICRRITFVR
jgi:hypothetical protein